MSADRPPRHSGAAARWGLLPALALLGSPAGATILTFDQGSVGNHENVDPDYGDDVEATLEGSLGYGVGAEGFTPNVQLSYGDTDPALWTTGYGNLTNVLFEDADGSGVLEVTFTADAGYVVDLHEFDLAAYSSAFASDPTVDAVTITDGTDTLFEQLDATVSESTSTPFDFTASPLSAETLVIRVDARNLGNLNDDIAIDNVRFGQSVPEPAGLALSAFALAGLAAGRRSG